MDKTDTQKETINIKWIIFSESYSAQTYFFIKSFWTQ